MHVLVANIHFEPVSYGGATVVAEEVVRELSRQTDWRITVVSASVSLGIEPYHMIRTQGAGVDHIIISLPRLLRGADSYLNSQVEALFGQLLSALAPDVVHAHCVQDLGVGALRAVEAHGIPLVVSVHDFWWLCERQFMINSKGLYCGHEHIRPDICRSCVDNMSDTRERDRILRNVLNKAPVITYPSSFTRKLYERSGINPAAGVVWPNGVRQPGPDFQGLQERRRQRDARTAFGFVGGPSQMKGWPVMRQAFAQLDRGDFVVNVVDASPDKSWWRPSDFTGLKGEWRILPRYSQENIDEFYATFDVLLFLSQWKETFGLTLREAAARGLEVIQTEGGGTTEYEGVEHAHIVQIGDGPDIVAGKISEVLRGPRRARRGKVRGYAEQARQLVDIINNMVEPPRSEINGPLTDLGPSCS